MSHVGHVTCHVIHRMLSELTHQVESSTREVSQLQAKLEQAHSVRVEEQAQRTKVHQEQLKSKFKTDICSWLEFRDPLFLL